MLHVNAFMENAGTLGHGCAQHLQPRCFFIDLYFHGVNDPLTGADQLGQGFILFRRELGAADDAGFPQSAYLKRSAQQHSRLTFRLSQELRPCLAPSATGM